MKRPGLVIVAFAMLSITATHNGGQQTREVWNEQTPVSEVLKAWGDDMPEHYYKGTPQQVVQGRELLTTGRTNDANGKAVWLQSKHYKCTHCHNLVQEDPDLRQPNADSRLVYAMERNIPYLQGSTLYGVVNRATWYNGDYVKKYGDEAKEAHKSLTNSIQLCATTCSQGRALDEWEVESVLAYLWSIELKLGDLRLDANDWDRLRSPMGEQDFDQPEGRIAWLKSYWADASPATFGDEPDDFAAGYGISGDPTRGEAIYELSCLHCHHPQGITYFALDQEQLTFKHLDAHIPKHDMYNLYHVVRDGVPSLLGEKAYMPNYTEERMTNAQVEDLRAYIELKSAGQALR